MSSSLSRLHDKIIVKSVDADGHLRPVSPIDNDSIRPTRLKDRRWTQLTYMTFWFSAVANVSNLYAASTGLTVGLSMWEAVGCSVAGYFLAGCLMALNGRAGALYRIPFPVLCRASWGPWGALWPTFNRAAMSVVWNGVTAVQGAQCIYVFLHAIFPSIENIPDKMGPKSALSSAGMICFLIYWLLNCAFLVVPVPKMKSLVYIKVFVYYAAVIAMTAWTVTLAGPTASRRILSAGSTIHGSDKSWMITRFLFVGLASCATFISNAADMQRYARRPNDVIWGQVLSFPVSGLIVAVFGNVIASASVGVVGELVWNPIDFLDMLMAGDRYTAGNRAGCALISAALAYSTIFSAIFENSIPAGNDIAALLPKYITVKRGFFICAVLSYAINPWYLLSSASVFINFLSSYQIFLSGITGILICDYYIIRRGKLNIPDLYTAHPLGEYHYFHGFGIRAFVAYLIAIVPNFYGFLNQMGVKASIGVQRFYYVAYPVGVLIGMGFYYAFIWLWNGRGAQIENGMGWQEPKEYFDEFDNARYMDGVVVEGAVEGVEVLGVNATRKV
ncbi:permease for cytosine/purines, uracil, thiamine, allantoin-domain-containing protein [Aspergillus karnatakaensis]|uniref:permease for cytosine/purines, uracil, thiamine, allantoin-domain-containing protein n=1 Tax=Aspergillus karnatakaensis TaxID=1810916 RepID=UPI003CCE10FC